jgi:hypothetical protein
MSAPAPGQGGRGGIVEEASVFDQISGLPVHVLVVHAAVVFVPLLALAAAVYALVPRLRSRVGWVAALLAVAAPGAAFVAFMSGREFKDRKYGGVPADALTGVNTHQHNGTVTFWLTLALGVVAALLVFSTSRNPRLPRPTVWAMVVIVLGLAAATGYYVFLAGDTGARLVHGGA